MIQLTEEYYAPGSLGTFNLQLQLDVVNNHPYTWKAGTYEMVIMPMLSGVFVNERGTSSTFISLLTKEDVIQASQQEPYTNRDPSSYWWWLHGLHQIRPGLALQ